MRITRIFVGCTTIEKYKKILLNQGQQHYLSNVIRLPKNSDVLIFNSKDGEWLAKFEKDYVIPHQQSRIQVQEYSYEITVCFAIPKSKTLKTIIRQSTELGATTLQPIHSDHTVNRIKDTDKLELWSIEAAQQCRRMSIPRILSPISFQEISIQYKNVIICDETSEDATVCDIPILNSYTIVIGPEGGFSPAELSLEGHRISLGKMVLRCDTAVVAAISQIRAVHSHLTRPIS
ncbi:RNA methyltransferase, RsmE family protein [Neorickettsia helminthoeca str. Oregon]|uniref:Ribosomal RNA small subunit methyltransferase E n=1 Tax=Neorickettsia helminthoeca str. Oregon TaxID=1286528 RepID=X5GVG1_9RICK|nr:RsmE family RNA methyltransferase [Neorickettsia helminthoeca]AHX11012.1 RNA methyltransferase, RsmE family protein [Neorickettsia helminthoeca str. Oregon]